MKIKYKIFTILLILLLLGGCMTQSQEKKSSISEIVLQLEGLSIDEFYEESYKQLLLRSPEALTFLGIAEDFGLRNDDLDNLSDEYILNICSL